jgi:hypothetical protein
MSPALIGLKIRTDLRHPNISIFVILYPGSIRGQCIVKGLVIYRSSVFLRGRRGIINRGRLRSIGGFFHVNGTATTGKY